MILKSIGYKSLPVPGIAFDDRKGVVPNVAGRVLRAVQGSTDLDQGLYVCGWLKRGPSGIIGTNLVDAEETVSSIVEDAAPGGRGLGKPQGLGGKLGVEGLREILSQKGVKAVDFNGWLKVDGQELDQGKAAGKVRQKVVEVAEMLKVAGVA